MGEKRGMKALEIWCRRVTDGYPGVKIENMTTSWRDGLAFCALIHHFRPDLIDFDRLDKRDILKNNELAFRVAERQLGIPALLDPEDMLEYEIPDRLSILTYLSQFYQAFSQQGGTSPSPRKHTTPVTDMLSPKTPNTGVKVGRGRIERCWTCERPVFLAERLVLGGKVRHRACFTCARCGHQLNPVSSYETESGDFVCEMCPDEEVNKTPSASEPTSLETPKTDVSVPEDTSATDGVSMVQDVPDPPSKPPDLSKVKFLSDILTDTSENNSGLTLETNLRNDENVCVIENPAQNNTVQPSNYEDAMELALDTTVNNYVVVPAHNDASVIDKDAHINEDVDKERSCQDSRTENLADKLDNNVNIIVEDNTDNITMQNDIVVNEALLNNSTPDNISACGDPTALENKSDEEVSHGNIKEEISKVNQKELIEEEKEIDASVVFEKNHRLSVKDRISALEKRDELLCFTQASTKNTDTSDTHEVCGLNESAEVLNAPLKEELENVIVKEDVSVTVDNEAKESLSVSEKPEEDEKPMESASKLEAIEGTDLNNSSEPLKMDNTNIRSTRVDDTTNALDFGELNRRLEAVSIEMDEEMERQVNASHDESKERKDVDISVSESAAAETVITVTCDDSSDYPKGMNPFGDSDEDGEALDEVPSSMTPVPAVRSCKKVELNKDGKTIIEAPQNLNPFWSDEDSEEDEEATKKPTPAPRSLRTPEPVPRNSFGSSTSLTSQSSSSGNKKKKRPAPQPPVENYLLPSSSPVSSISSPSSYASRSPAMRRRKSRPAPPPPTPVDKERKDQENKVKQNLSPVDKSMYGKWKRKKGAAPAIPVAPQKRRIIPLVAGDVVKEVFDLEVQQGELERQGVEVEQSIRRIDEGDGEDKDIEDLMLQLFEIVNRKNELFRRQAELMYLRRQQRLEEEQADLEYQIRCLMSRNKNEADPALEEELIGRLLDVVERRNEIVDCLEMNRKRQIEEDQSIHDRLLTFSMKDNPDSAGEESSGSSKKSSHMSVLKLLKKRKKEKKREKESKEKSKDVDADIDESVEAENEAKPAKTKKKWFTLEKLH